MIIVTLLLPFALISCKPDNDSSPPPIVEERNPAIIWKNPISNMGFSSNAYIKDSILLFGVDGNQYTFVALNINTGDTIWIKKDFPSSIFSPSLLEETAIMGNNIVLSGSRWIVVLDVHTGLEKWRYELKNGERSICIIDNWIYKADYVNKQRSSLYRFDINSGQKEFLFTIDNKKYSTYTPGLNMPVKWISPEEDEILILQNRTFNWAGVGQQDPALASRMDILAYNLTTDSVLWYRSNLDTKSSQSRPAISGDKVYFFGLEDAYCIEASTGKILWKYNTGADPEGDFNLANILLIDDKLIVKPDSRWIHAVNKETGKNIWTNKNTVPSPSLLTHHNGFIFFTGGRIIGIDINNGKKAVDWNNGGKGSWISPIAINPDNGYIYTTDTKYFYCIDPKKLN